MLCARRLKPTEIKKENDSWGVWYHKFSLKAGLQTSHGQRRCFYWSKVMMSINFLLRQGHYKITFNQKDDITTKTPLFPHDEYKRTFRRLFFVFIFFHLKVKLYFSDIVSLRVNIVTLNYKLRNRNRVVILMKFKCV